MMLCAARLWAHHVKTSSALPPGSRVYLATDFSLSQNNYSYLFDSCHYYRLSLSLSHVLLQEFTAIANI